MVVKDLNRRKIDGEVVHVLNNYGFVDEIKVKNVITNDEKVYTFGPDIVDPLQGLEPRSVLSKEKKQIDKFVRDRKLEIRYYIKGEELFKSEIYSMEEGYGKGTFKVNGKPYIMKVGSQYRQLNEHDMSFLEGLLN